ncbi:MAG: hypothetical protein JO151_14050 [Verrucomicrobia bacterium]|nr:hypothetical protein [Verrucomicrobiota bacterium]
MKFFHRAQFAPNSYHLLHEAGVPAAVVQSLIGHDSEEVHQLYVAVGKEALASAAARLPDLV